MESNKPSHRKQTQAPGRKPPRTIDSPRTVRVDPEIWDIAMSHAIKLSAKRGYIVTLKESIGDMVRAYQRQEQQNGKSIQPPDQ